jgi:hypothetical protein
MHEVIFEPGPLANLFNDKDGRERSQGMVAIQEEAAGT